MYLNDKSELLMVKNLLKTCKNTKILKCFFFSEKKLLRNEGGSLIVHTSELYF